MKTMHQNNKLILISAFAVSSAFAQQVAMPAKPSEVTSASSNVQMQPEYVKTLGRMAYVWGWPMINQFNRRDAITRAPQPGRLNGVLPVGPRGRWGMLNDYIDPAQTFVACPNQDVVYGLGFFSLDEEPGAVATEKEVIKPFFEWKHNGKPAGNGWNRSENNAKTGFDYFNRTGTAKSNMFDNKPNETQYFYIDTDSAGAQLEGSKTYEITFAKGEEPPVNGFWSLTLYNDQHFFHPNDLKRYSLGTKNKTLKHNADGSLTLYAGAKSPGKDKESNWLPAPERHLSLYIRAYWGKEPILDGSWKPPSVEKVK